MYGKLFASSFEGSMFGSGPLMFAVWSYVLSHAHRRTCTVELNARLLAATIGKVTPDEVEEVIEAMCSPDPASRTQTEEGRKLLRQGVYQFAVVNLAAYDALASEEVRRDYFRTSKRAQRARTPAEVTYDDAIAADGTEDLVAGLEQKFAAEEWAREEAEELAARGNARRDGPIPFNREELADAWKSLWDDFIATRVPRPIGKKQSERHFRASIKTQADMEALGRALIAYRASDRVIAGFVQQGSTWLNNWRDWVTYQDWATYQEPAGGSNGNGKSRKAAAVVYTEPSRGGVSVDDIRDLERSLRMASSPDDWDHGGVTMQEVAHYLDHIRANFAESLETAPTLTEWIAAPR